jgi:hypothetical protein
MFSEPGPLLFPFLHSVATIAVGVCIYSNVVSIVTPVCSQVALAEQAKGGDSADGGFGGLGGTVCAPVFLNAHVLLLIISPKFCLYALGFRSSVVFF